MYVVVRTSVCVCKRDKFLKRSVCLIIMKYMYLKSKPSSNREILIKKSPIFTPSCLLCNGEVIAKESYCVIYEINVPSIA